MAAVAVAVPVVADRAGKRQRPQPMVLRQAVHRSGKDGATMPMTPVLVFDGGCVFCRHFAELSALRSGIAGLQIRDGRSDQALRQQLAERGFCLRDGAILLVGDQVLHGAQAITWLCARMSPGPGLLQWLALVFADGSRTHRLYPVVLLARRLALAARGLPVDPDQGFLGRSLGRVSK